MLRVRVAGDEPARLPGFAGEVVRNCSLSRTRELTLDTLSAETTRAAWVDSGSSAIAGRRFILRSVACTVP